jgi:hypothetical protein
MCVLEKHGSVQFDPADLARLINGGYNVAVTARGPMTTFAGVKVEDGDKIVVYLQHDKE